MPEETPEFVATTLSEGEGGEKPKKRVIRPRVARSARAGVQKRAMEKKLVSIYEDDNGRLPNMKKIKIKKSHPVLGCFFALLIIGGLSAAAAWAGFFALPSLNKFSEDAVKLEISGPAENALGATTTYTFTFKNEQKTALRNLVLNVNYPDGFVFVESSAEAKNAGHTEWEIGTLGGNKEGILTITGKIYGALNQETSWRVFLKYQPENFNSELQKVATYKIKISSIPVSLFITGPDKVEAGNDARFSFIVTKTGDWWPKSLELQPIFPANFYIASGTPKLGKNNRWLFDPLALVSPSSTLESITFTVNGKFGESTEEVLPIKSVLNLPIGGNSYQIAESSLETFLIKNGVGLNLTVNGAQKNFNSQPGDILNITVNLKNNSRADLNKATIKLTLDAPAYKKQSVLNWLEIVDKNNGLIKGENLSDTLRRGQIVWSYTGLAELKKIKPGQELNFDIRLPIKNAGTFDLNALKEYKINIISDIDFADATGAKDNISSNPIIVTLNSDLKFEARDEVKTKDGKETHNVDWVLTNNFHPLKNVKLVADLYGDISWNLRGEAPAGEAVFDAEAKRLTWTINELPENTDVLALPFSVVINKKNPTQDLLISRVQVTAEDTVTGETLSFMGDELSLLKPTISP